MKPLKNLNGLGDAVELVTTVTGIKAATEAISKATGKDCGCAQRKAKLNQKFPFQSNQPEQSEDV